MSKATDLLADDSIFLFDNLPEELYYFAYGPNMNDLQMRKRCSKFQTTAAWSFARG